MRAVLLILIAGSIAFADSGRTLESLVKSGRLDPKVVARELGKLQAKAKFTRPLTAGSCVLTSDGRDLVFQCSERVCPGACQVQRNEATIRVRDGAWSVTATTAKHLGDTGACGCCL